MSEKKRSNRRWVRLVMLIGAVLAFLLFLYVHVNVRIYGEMPNPTRTVSWELGAQPWPWLSYDDHVARPDGSTHTGFTLHPLAGSWFFLIAAFALLALRPKKMKG